MSCYRLEANRTIEADPRMTSSPGPSGFQAQNGGRAANLQPRQEREDDRRVEITKEVKVEQGDIPHFDENDITLGPLHMFMLERAQWLDIILDNKYTSYKQIRDNILSNRVGDNLGVHDYGAKRSSHQEAFEAMLEYYGLEESEMYRIQNWLLTKYRRRLVWKKESNQVSAITQLYSNMFLSDLHAPRAYWREFGPDVEEYLNHSRSRGKGKGKSTKGDTDVKNDRSQ